MNRSKTFRIIFFTIIIVLFVSALPPLANARQGHISLLTVSQGSEPDDTPVGGVADLYLRVEPGSGNVYVDSFPLTKLDTQSSIRYANRVACDYLQRDCTQYDFFYTIRAGSGTVGGPSAGAAIAVLTVSVLDNQEVDPTLALTGTINSGGIIGAVSGINAKIEGARAAGIKTVLVPILASRQDYELNYSATAAPILPVVLGNSSNESSVVNNSVVNNISYNGNTPSDAPYSTGTQRPTTTSSNSTSSNNTSSNNISSNNTSLDSARAPRIVRIAGNATFTLLPAPRPTYYGTAPFTQVSSSLRIVRIGTLDEALFYTTGKNYSSRTSHLAAITPPTWYVDTMRDISAQLCERTAMLKERIIAHNSTFNDPYNYTRRAASLNDSYSRASLCFSANIELAKLDVASYSRDERLALAQELVRNASLFINETHDRSLVTIEDVETYAIVQERAIEAQDLLLSLNESDPDPANLGYARERLLSAQRWSAFFGKPTSGRTLPADRAYLRTVCLATLSEAQERVDYIRLYLPTYVAGMDDLLDTARKDATREPVLCIFSAKKAMAQANLLASALSLDPEQAKLLLAKKLFAADMMLRVEQDRGFFPLVGYSYDEYATVLKEEQPYSALSYAEYSLELSSIDIYFPQRSAWHIPLFFYDRLVLFLFGLLLGAALVYLLLSGRVNSRSSDRPAKLLSSRRKNKHQRSFISRSKKRP